MFDIDWKNCTNKEEILSQYTEDEFKKLVPYGIQPEPGEFRYVKFGNTYASIDEPMADLIILLNDSCYTTEYCCCGHKFQNGRFRTEYYIKFEETDFNKTLIKHIVENVLENNDYEYYTKTVASKKLLKEDVRKHITYFEANRSTIYFRWRNKADIKWINNLIISCM